MMKTDKKSSSELKVRSKFNLKRKSRRLQRNLNRRSRRKRSKVRYYSKLRNYRGERNTTDLCESLEVFDITGMEWTPVQQTSRDVASWYQQDQIAYWKSRALSSEYENRMLLDHLRGIYAKQIQDYANCANQEEDENDEENEAEHTRSKQAIDADGANNKVAMIEPLAKERRSEMEKLYGSKAARIMGMETAVQLNYELHLEKDAGNVPKWPHMPLKMKF